MQEVHDGVVRDLAASFKAHRRFITSGSGEWGVGSGE